MGSKVLKCGRIFAAGQIVRHWFAMRVKVNTVSWKMWWFEKTVNSNISKNTAQRTDINNAKVFKVVTRVMHMLEKIGVMSKTCV